MKIISTHKNTMVEYNGIWLKLEDQLAMVETAPDSPWKEMDIAEILSRIAACDAKISALAA